MAICENTIAFSLTLLRDLLSFENWRGGGQKGFVVGALPPCPPSGYGLGSYGQRSTTRWSNFSIRLIIYCRDTRCCPCIMASLCCSLRTTCSTDCAPSPACTTCLACSCSEAATRLTQCACTHSTSNSPHFSPPSWRSLRCSLLRCSISPLATNRCRARETSARGRCVSSSEHSASTRRVARNGCISRIGCSPTACSSWGAPCFASTEYLLGDRLIDTNTLNTNTDSKLLFSLEFTLEAPHFLKWQSKDTQNSAACKWIKNMKIECCCSRGRCIEPNNRSRNSSRKYFFDLGKLIKHKTR